MEIFTYLSKKLGLIYNQQKQEECFFAKNAARLINAEWELIAREESGGGPDFIVHEGVNSFGLEVYEIFKGEVQPRKGSKLKEEAATNQRLIDEIRQQYENTEKNVPLYVKFLGDVNSFSKSQILKTLLDMGLGEKSPSYSGDVVLESDSGDLKIFVRRLPDGWGRDRLCRSDWFSIDDSLGWIEKDSCKIQEAIDKKSQKIDQYRANVAKELELKDPENCEIRLLIVSDHMWNYGQVELDEEQPYNLREFNAVYFFPFPEKPITLRSS
ncbi:MAG: hypothetical protein OXI37_03415 [Gammaproteobacteria bacterium]|nr:hypothetical protein [Gammaproteobacteria bacterium]